MDLLTNSRLKTYRRCARLEYIEYQLGIRPIAEEDVLRFGSLMHLGLEAWWNAQRGIGSLEPLPAALAAIQSSEADPFDRVRAEELLRGYHYRWEGERYEVLAVEMEFRASLVNPQTGAASRTFELGGKLDALVRDSAGRVLIVEHKTTSEDLGSGSTYWARLRMDGQVSTYFAGAAALGHEAAACLYDVIGKPTIRPASVPLTDASGVKIVNDAAGNRVRTKDGKKWRETGDTAQGYVLQTRPETTDEFRARLAASIAESPERYYQRGEVVRLEDEIAAHAFDVWQLGRILRESQLAQRAPKNPDACIAYGRTCAFFDVCSGAASLDDPLRFKRLDNIHPELARASAA